MGDLGTETDENVVSSSGGDPAAVVMPLAHAAAYTCQDWPVLVLHTPDSEGRCSCGKVDCPNPGKHPRFHPEDLAHGAHSATLDPDVIARWSERWPDANIGIATGEESGIFVLDCDRKPLSSSEPLSLSRFTRTWLSILRA